MYGTHLDYARANDFRFSLWVRGDGGVETPDFRFKLERYWLSGIALFRLMMTSLGWPILAVLVIFGAVHERTRLVSISVALFLVAIIPTHSAGIDTIGPVHVMELVPFLLFLALAGVSLLARAAPRPELATNAVVMGLITAGLVMYWPARINAIHTSLAGSHRPYEAVEGIDADNGLIIFVRYPFIDPCASKPSSGFVFWRPMVSPSFDDPIIYLNHISVPLDRKLMQHAYPDREGYIMFWTGDCEIVLEDLRNPKLPELPGLVGPDGADTADLEAEFDRQK
jgi:hypothetical protein